MWEGIHMKKGKASISKESPPLIMEAHSYKKLKCFKCMINPMEQYWKNLMP